MNVKISRAHSWLVPGITGVAAGLIFSIVCLIVLDENVLRMRFLELMAENDVVWLSMLMVMASILLFSSARLSENIEIYRKSPAVNAMMANLRDNMAISLLFMFYVMGLRKIMPQGIVWIMLSLFVLIAAAVMMAVYDMRAFVALVRFEIKLRNKEKNL